MRNLVLTFCCILAGIVHGIRNSIEDALIVDYAPHYYYQDLREKMTESMSINNCTISGRGFTIPDREDIEIAEYDISVEIVHPTDELKKERGTIFREKFIDETKLYVQVSPNLCKSKSWNKFKRGEFKRAKGCFNSQQVQRGSKTRVINRYAATLHPNHARCDTTAAVGVCLSGSEAPMPTRRQDREYHNYPFAVSLISGVIVARSGFLALPCGIFGLYSSCEAAKWGIPVALPHVDEVNDCRVSFANSRSLQPTGDSPPCALRQFDRVFVMSQYDDTQIGQFVLESLPRLVYHLDYILSNANVVIHFGFTKQPTVPPFVLPHLYFRWLGLQDRLVNGSVFAEEVYMPREGGCQDVSYNAWEILQQRRTFLKLATHTPSRNKLYNEIITRFAHVPFESDKGKPFVILIERNMGSKFIQNMGDIVYRVWPNNSASEIRRNLEESFPQYEFRSFSDKNESLLSCPPCAVRLFNRAALVIGIHGAGLSNTLYMEAGGVVVEVLPYFDSRMAPLTGIFPRLSAVVGLHHYSYYIENTVFDPAAFVKDILTFHNKVKLWH